MRRLRPFTALVALFGSCVMAPACVGTIYGGDPGEERDAAPGGGRNDAPPPPSNVSLPPSCDDEPGSLPLNSQQKELLSYIGADVLPALVRLYGGETEALQTVVEVSWWSLKEGVLDTANPIGFSLCDRPRVNLTDQPLALCDRDAWQVGIAAIQAPRPSAVASDVIASRIAQYETLFVQAYPQTEVSQGLVEVATAAGHDASVAQSIAQSAAHLRASWLLRVGAIGFSIQAPIVRGECIEEDLSWCHGSGWPQSEMFAATPTVAAQTRDELRGFFESCLP